ncbi:MAG: Rv3235 family protein [Candidatus Nanopelagicales bacterium]
MNRQQTLDLAWQPRGVDPVPRHPVPPLPDDTSRWIARICAAVAEVAAGDRAARQLFTVMTPSALELLQRRARVTGTRNGPIRGVGSLRLSRPRPDVIEATAVVQGSRRYQAVALEIRRRRGRWLVTAAEIR